MNLTFEYGYLTFLMKLLMCVYQHTKPQLHILSICFLQTGLSGGEHFDLCTDLELLRPIPELFDPDVDQMDTIIVIGSKVYKKGPMLPFTTLEIFHGDQTGVF